MQETWIQSLSQEDSQEKEMATHSRTLAWRTPWTEEPGGLWSTGCQELKQLGMHTCLYVCVCVSWIFKHFGTRIHKTFFNVNTGEGNGDTKHFLMLTLEKEMATHSSTLAWKIPWTENPDRLQSMASQRVGHNWAISLSFFFHIHSHTAMCCGHHYWDFSEVIFLSIWISKESSSIFHILPLSLHILDKFSSTANSILYLGG